MKVYKYRHSPYKGKRLIEVGRLNENNEVELNSPNKNIQEIGNLKDIGSYHRAFEIVITDKNGDKYREDIELKNQVTQISLNADNNIFKEYYSSIGFILNDNIIYWDQYLP